MYDQTSTRNDAEILNIARSAGPLAILRPQTVRKSPLWARFSFYEIWPKFWFSQKSEFFITTWQTFTWLKLLIKNFLGAVSLRIWIDMISAADSELESPNDWQELEHDPKIYENHGFHENFAPMEDHVCTKISSYSQQPDMRLTPCEPP